MSMNENKDVGRWLNGSNETRKSWLTDPLPTAAEVTDANPVAGTTDIASDKMDQLGTIKV